MDGTLLNSKGEVSPQFFKLLKELQKHQIHFVGSSGRQYNSIIHKLDAIKNAIIVIAGNGGITKQKENVLQVNKLEPQKIIEIIPVLRNIKDTHIVLCGKEVAYIETTDKKFVSMFNEYYKSFKIVDDLTKIIFDTDSSVTNSASSVQVLGAIEMGAGQIIGISAHNDTAIVGMGGGSGSGGFRMESTSATIGNIPFGRRSWREIPLNK